MHTKLTLRERALATSAAFPRQSIPVTLALDSCGRLIRQRPIFPGEEHLSPWGTYRLQRKATLPRETFPEAGMIALSH